MNVVRVVHLGGVTAPLLEHAVGFCGHRFLADCRMESDPDPLTAAPGEQLLASRLLERLLSWPHGRFDRLLGLTGYDLHLPMLSFVFGQAQLEGPAAVVSVARLRQEFYGLPPDDELLRARLEREVAHELGHTFGLVHCDDPHCCMSLSTAIEQVDDKLPDFCRECRGRLRERQAQERLQANEAIAPDSQEVQP